MLVCVFVDPCIYKYIMNAELIYLNSMNAG